MSNTEIKSAVSNIKATVDGLENFINKPENYNSFGASLLEGIVVELKKQAESIDAIEYMYG